jgi:hypothetical protein
MRCGRNGSTAEGRASAVEKDMSKLMLIAYSKQAPASSCTMKAIRQQD